MKPPSLVPLTDPDTLEVFDGLQISTPDFCKSAVKDRAACKDHYAAFSLNDQYLECPFGFTTRGFAFDGKRWFVSGVVAHPRFDSDRERAMGKRYPGNRVSREAIDATVRLARDLEIAKSEVIADAAKVLPQAFHELRKLNGAVIQHAEREINERGETRSLLSIKGAAELMRNNFDILEALSNIDGMKSLPLDSTVNIFDLAFKMKRVYQERAASRSIAINVYGARAIVKGSQKSFPLVPAVLLENAIKYGTASQPVIVNVEARDSRAILTVENLSKHQIDPARCFERGARFAKDIEGGGFGLFLAKEVVHAHRGTIHCETKDGLVKMTVVLPLSAVIQ